MLRAVYLADNHAKAEKLAEEGVIGTAFREFFYHFGFFEAWREAEDDVKYGKKMLPAEEATIARMERADYAPFRTPVEVPQWRKQWRLWRAARNPRRIATG